MAPTYIVNAVALIFVMARLLGWEIPYTSAELENFITMAVILATPLFTMIRQVITGRATVLGGKGPAAN